MGQTRISPTLFEGYLKPYRGLRITSTEAISGGGIKKIQHDKQKAFLGQLPNSSQPIRKLPACPADHAGQTVGRGFNETVFSGYLSSISGPRLEKDFAETVYLLQRAACACKLGFASGK
jgi:hypothetical protein